MRLLSLKIENPARFRRDEDERVSQQDHHIEHKKEHIEFHLFLLYRPRAMAGKIRTRNRRTGSLANAWGAQATGGFGPALGPGLTITCPAEDRSRQALLPDYDFIVQRRRTKVNDCGHSSDKTHTSREGSGAFVL